MASKRASHQKGQVNDDTDRDHQGPGKRRHGKSEQAETSRSKAQWTNDIVLHLEHSVRKVVQEELPPILQRYLSPCCGLSLNRPSGTSGRRTLQLRFMNKLPPTIFTHSKIIAEEVAPLGIALFDEYCRVKEGHLSSVRVELCVLDGEFGTNGSEDWTAEEFNANILREREGQRRLLNGGGRFVTLENGVGSITNIEFTDNSSWTRNRKFRLGVKLMHPSFVEADIREDRSEPFVVKDKRGESYKKHDRPSVNDEIWRLRKIAKDGKRHKQLSSHGIKTVKDLLRLYITDQTSLREKIGNIASKSWDAIIEHAKACVIDDGERYICHYCVAEQSIILVFNCIYEVVEVSFNGQNYPSIESLNLKQKYLVERAKQHAYKNVKDLIPYETSTHGLAKTLAGVQAEQWGALQVLQPFDLQVAQQGQQETWPYLCQPSTSTSQFGESAQNDQLVGTDQLPELGEMPLNRSSAEGEFISGVHIDGNEWPPGGSQIDSSSYFSHPTPWGQANPFYLPYDGGTESVNHSFFANSAVVTSSKGKRKTVWHKIRSALKWVKLLALKRKANIFPYQYQNSCFY